MLQCCFPLSAFFVSPFHYDDIGGFVNIGNKIGCNGLDEEDHPTLIREPVIPACYFSLLLQSISISTPTISWRISSALS